MSADLMAAVGLADDEWTVWCRGVFFSTVKAGAGLFPLVWESIFVDISFVHHTHF